RDHDDLALLDRRHLQQLAVAHCHAGERAVALVHRDLPTMEVDPGGKRGCLGACLSNRRAQRKKESHHGSGEESLVHVPVFPCCQLLPPMMYSTLSDPPWPKVASSALSVRPRSPHGVPSSTFRSRTRRLPIACPTVSFSACSGSSSRVTLENPPALLASTTSWIFLPVAATTMLCRSGTTPSPTSCRAQSASQRRCRSTASPGAVLPEVEVVSLTDAVQAT